MPEPQNRDQLAQQIAHDLGSFRLGLKTLLAALDDPQAGLEDARALSRAMMTKLDQILRDLKGGT
jgi:hypothetical protein